MYVQEQERQGSKMRALLSKRPWRAFTEQPHYPSNFEHLSESHFPLGQGDEQAYKEGLF